MPDPFKIPKIVPVGSFEMPGVDLFVNIAQDPDKRRRKIASPVLDAWGPIDPVPGHTLVHVIALGDYESSGFNANGDAFKRAFLAKAHPTFITHGGLFTRHKIWPEFPGEDVRKGDVIKTAQWPEMGRVELIVAANDNKCAHWLGDIEAGKPVAFSMGFDHDYDVCSICDHKAYKRAEYCLHVRKGAPHPYGMGKILPDGRKCGVFNPSGVFNDISDVPVGACMIAFDLGKVAGAAEAGASGLDLGHYYFRRFAEADPRKVALIREMAAEERRAMALGDRLPAAPCPAGLPGIACCPRSFFHEASRRGQIPMRAFFKVALGAEYPRFADAAEGAARKQAGFLQEVAADPEATARIAENRSYDRPAYCHVPREGLAAIGRIFDESKAAAPLAALEPADPLGCSTLTPAERVLSEEYLAYRVANSGGRTAREAVLYV